MPEAARQFHQVAHSLGMAALIAGAVVGGVLAVGITVATGGAGAIVIASAVAGGVSAGGGLGKMIGSHFSGMPSGPITLNCVSAVLVEGFPAATVGSMAMCTGGMIGPPHPSSPIVQGSSTVFINSKPAARKGDKLACSAAVNEGASTVIIGGETVTVGPMNPEIPQWVDWGLMGLGMLSGYGLLRAGGMGVLAAVTRVGGATAGGMGGSMLAGYGAEQLGYEPGSWGHDLASLGGGLVGGYGGYKGVDRAAPNRFFYREDSFPYSQQGKSPGRLKSYIDEEGNLNPANADGTATVQDHVRGSEPKKSDSPYTSTSGERSPGKSYGDHEIKVNAGELERDIRSGKVKDVEILKNDEVLRQLETKRAEAQTRYDQNPTPKNRERLDRAEGDIANATRDKEILIKGKVPAKYVRVKKKR